MKTGVTIEGADKLNDKLKRIVRRQGPKAYKTALTVALLRIEANSLRRTPIDTGKLRRSGSGNATVTKANADGAEGVVFYTANYSIFVHEMDRIPHNIGESGFLRKAVMEELPVLAKVLGVSLKTTFSKRQS